MYLVGVMVNVKIPGSFFLKNSILPEIIVEYLS